MATILQVEYVNYDTTGNQVLAPGVWTDLAGMVKTITPISALSVIRISAVLNGDRLLNDATPLCVRITRDGVPVGVGGGAGVQCYGRIFTTIYFESIIFVDSPATVLPVEYKLQVFDNGANTIYMNTDAAASYSGMSTMTLEEIG